MGGRIGSSPEIVNASAFGEGNVLIFSSCEIIEFVAHNATNITIQIENQLATAPIDPNWFYSAVAQSSAAIGGLMGAFLTTKLINQKIIINQLKNEIKNYDS